MEGGLQLDTSCRFAVNDEDMPQFPSHSNHYPGYGTAHGVSAEAIIDLSTQRQNIAQKISLVQNAARNHFFLDIFKTVSASRPQSVNALAPTLAVSFNKVIQGHYRN